MFIRKTMVSIFSSLFAGLGTAILLASSVVSVAPAQAEPIQAMNNPTSVELSPFKDPWPSAKLRWWDIENNPFDTFLDNLGQSGQFNYTAPTANQYVRVTYDKAPATGYFKGYVEARGLKPNFAYQIKLAGKPVKGKRGWGAYGDDVANERLGYVGRWWCDTSHATQTNYDDSHYVNFYKNVSGSAAHDIYGYLFMGIFVTDEFGNANSNFNGHYSYHITWQPWQSGAKQTPAGTWTVQSQTAPYYAYGYQLDPAPVQLWHEYEHNMNSTRPLIASLPTGAYNCRLLLTEETFHNNFGGGTNSTAGGFWQTVLASEDYAKNSSGAYLTDGSGNLLPDTNTSNDIAFTIGTAPVIGTQPVSKTICSGQAVSFSVVSSGSGPFTYQWQKGTTPLVNGAGIAGVTTDTLTINPATAAHAATNYNVIVTSPYGSATSTNAALTLNEPVSITTQPANQSASVGGAVSFSVSATGSGLAYQWRRGTAPLSNGGNISGATTSILTVNPVSAADIATDYNVVVSGACDNATSNNASLASSTPIISGFSPASGVAGTIVTVTGDNLGSATAKLNNLAVTIVTRSANNLTFKVPNAASSGPIVVTSSSGTASSASNFLVLPKITSFTPRLGDSGTAVTITGYGFSNATGVLFDAKSAAFTVISANKITATAPANVLTGIITVQTAEGAFASTLIFTARPRVSSFSPGSGVAGTVVTVSGENLGASNTSIKLNGINSPVTARSADSLTFKVPSTATTGKIAVTNSAGTVLTATNFTVLPKITAFSPAKAKVGARVTISGTTLGDATQVLFNGVGVAPSTIAATKVTAVVPANATTGEITIVTPAGNAVSATNFTVLP